MDNKKEYFSHAANALILTDSIIKECGPRLAGDASTHKAADIIHDTFQKNCDDVVIEEFITHPQAFLDWMKVNATFYIIGLFFYWINIPIIFAILITLEIIIMVFELIFYKELIDIFFPKKKGRNVIGKMEPENEVTQQIIISGHHDSAYIFNFFIKKPKLFPYRLLSVIILMFVTLFFTWFTTIYYLNYEIFPSFNLAIKIFFSFGLIINMQGFYFHGKIGTPGAGDNLISTSIAAEIGEIINKNKKKHRSIRNTRIILASWDAEESGLKGAKAYCNKHIEELKDIPTCVINLDSIYCEKISILKSDINGTAKLSKKLAEIFHNIANDLHYHSDIISFPFMAGGTDAGEFGRKKIPAISIVAMPAMTYDPKCVYHTPKDTVDAIEPQIVETLLKIITELIYQYDDKKFKL